MNNLRCEYCNINFKQPRCYKEHLKSKRHQQNITNELKISLPFKCHCGKQYIHRQSLYNHKKKCDYIAPNVEVLMKEVIEKKDSEIKEIIDKKDQQIEELRKQVEMLIGNTGKNIASNSNSTIGNQNNIQNQQNVNITVNSFGSENIDHITDQIICKLIKTAPFTCVPQLIEKIHFDPEHPENHNIKITNKKLNYAEIVKDNKWITANKKKVIDDVIQKSYDILDEKYNDNKEDISDKRKERFENFQEKFENEDESLRKNMKNDVDLLLINGTNEVHK
jgi:23S rRNA pseudoU1915 N3-methylase RlmH